MASVKDAIENGAEFTLLAADTLCAKNVEIGRCAREFIENRLSDGGCFEIKSLAVDGVDITELGACGQLVGKVLERLLFLTARGFVKNEKRILLEKAEEILSEIHE